MIERTEKHLEDAAVAAIADGELHLVDAASLKHFERCEACSTRVADHALASFALTAALREMPRHAAVRVQPKKSSTFVAAALGLLVAAIASVPSLLGADGRAIGSAARVLVAALSKGASVVGRHTKTPGWTMTMVALFVVAGVVIAVVNARKTSMRSES